MLTSLIRVDWEMGVLVGVTTRGAYPCVGVEGLPILRVGRKAN